MYGGGVLQLLENLQCGKSHLCIIIIGHLYSFLSDALLLYIITYGPDHLLLPYNQHYYLFGSVMNIIEKFFKKYTFSLSGGPCICYPNFCWLEIGDDYKEQMKKAYILCTWTVYMKVETVPSINILSKNILDQKYAGTKYTRTKIYWFKNILDQKYPGPKICWVKTAQFG